MSDLQSVNLTSGVNEQGEPFVTIAAVSVEGQFMIGQLPPEEVRQMALNWLAVAEAAEQDAAVFRLFDKMELPAELSAHVITELRNSRPQEPS